MTTTYLPYIVRADAPDAIMANFGAQVDGGIKGNERWVVPMRVYQWPARWNDCEPEPGVYSFPEYMLYNSYHLGRKQIIGTKTCPLWARLWPDNLGSPPKEECYEVFASWVCNLINLYHPWGIEVWNEPDCRAEDAALTNFGAWYDGLSWFDSGYRYGDFTRVVYDFVKCRNPNTNLLVGALMNVNELESAAFLTGARAGGLKGDYLSFHGYITERASFDRIFNLSASLRSIVPLPTICTETSVLSWIDSDAHRLLQRDYLQYIIDRLRTAPMGITSVLWYTLANNNWLNSDLQYGFVPLPAWQLFARELG